MSIDDLREQGVLLPEEEWGEHRLETTVPLVPLAVGYLTAVLSLVAMFVGGGGTLTWIGAGTFLVALYAVTWMCDRAVLRQRARVRRESGGASAAETGGADDGGSSGEGAREP
jgi:hypothetical protein